jgi:hypothetical protein
VTANRWTVERDGLGTPYRLAYNARTPAPIGAPWCDELIIRDPELSRQHARLGPAGFDALAVLVEDHDRRTLLPTGERLAEDLERFLAPMRCPDPPRTVSGMHCAECCMGTGWADVHSNEELEAARALDAALTKLRAALR